MSTLSTQMIPASSIYAASNDRKSFDSAALGELAASIDAHGLAQPPTVRPIGDRYEIVAGERRIRAMRDVLGWSELPVMVRELDDSAAAAIMLAENVQRADLDPIEEAEAYASRIERFGATITDVATLASVPASRVRSRLELLKLAAEGRLMVASKALPLRFAGLMVNLDSDRQLLALKAYNERPIDFGTFSALCSRLQADQDQESMFDTASFLQVETFIADAEQVVEQSTTVADDMADPVGAKDIASRLGVKAQTVAMWNYRGLMPKPRWHVSGQPVWQWSDIVKWNNARKGRDDGWQQGSLKSEG